MASGKYRHRLSFTKPGEPIKNNRGGYTQDPIVVYQCWGKVEPVSDKEQITAKQVESEVTHLVEIRYTKSVQITLDLQIDYKGRNLEILSAIDVDERHREYRIKCREVVG